ncbi:MAG: hypothetical protein WDW38_009056 [Sanguina aurantia]
MEPATTNASSGQAPAHPSQAPMFSPPSYTFPPPSAASTPSTTSTPASSGPDTPGPGYPALKAEPCSTKAAKPKRVRNNVGPKHQLEELQQVVAQKNQQIAQLLVENNRLKDTTGVLELVIQCRNHQVSLGLGHVPAGQRGPSGSKLQPSELTVTVCVCPIQVTRLQQGVLCQDATGIATTPLATDAAALAAYARLTAPQLMATFKPVLNDMSVALLAAEDPSNSAGQAALAALMANFHYVVQHVSLANTEILKTVGMTLNGDSVMDNDVHWAAVASSLNLTPRQQADSIILHDLYMRWTSRINAERHQYSCQLSVAMEATKYADTFRGIAYDGGEDGQQANDVELMQKLHRTVVQDRWVAERRGSAKRSPLSCPAGRVTGGRSLRPRTVGVESCHEAGVPVVVVSHHGKCLLDTCADASKEAIGAGKVGEADSRAADLAEVEKRKVAKAVSGKRASGLEFSRCLILLVGEVLTTRILTHTQWARSVVQSYPFVLDVWALLRAVTGLYRAASAP